MAETIQVHGLRELGLKLKTLPDKVAKKHLKRATNKAVDPVVLSARALAPFKSGALRANIKKRNNRSRNKFEASTGVGVLTDEKAAGLRQVKKMTGRKVRSSSKMGRKYVWLQDAATRRAAGNKTGLTGFANSDVFYWRFFEFGTSKMAARPFLRPAFALSRFNMIERLGYALRKGLFKEAKLK